MPEPSRRDVQLAGRFLEIAKRYTCEGWIEYLLWETIEGKRDRPFPFMDRLTDEETSSLIALRDEAKIWLIWDTNNNRWATVQIAAWRPYAEKRTSTVVLNELNDMRHQ